MSTLYPVKYNQVLRNVTSNVREWSVFVGVRVLLVDLTPDKTLSVPWVYLAKAQIEAGGGAAVLSMLSPQGAKSKITHVVVDLGIGGKEEGLREQLEGLGVKLWSHGDPYVVKVAWVMDTARDFAEKQSLDKLHLSMEQNQHYLFKLLP